MKLGDTFPAFSAVTNLGKIYNFHDWMGDSWAILFSHPADFTPVCTTELARAVQMAGEFNKRQVKMIALSCDSVESHRNWIRDILTYSEIPGLTSGKRRLIHMREQGGLWPIRRPPGETAMGIAQLSTGYGPVFCYGRLPVRNHCDEDRKLAIELEMLDPAEKNSAGMALTARAVFIIDPTKKLRAQILYPATTGRDFNEILRVIDSLQLTGRLPVATPEGWKNVKDACMVEPNVAMSKAEALFGEVDTVPLPSGKPYLRRVHIKE